MYSQTCHTPTPSLPSPPYTHYQQPVLTSYCKSIVNNVQHKCFLLNRCLTSASGDPWKIQHGSEQHSLYITQFNNLGKQTSRPLGLKHLCQSPRIRTPVKTWKLVPTQTRDRRIYNIRFSWSVVIIFVNMMIKVINNLCYYNSGVHTRLL